MIRRWFRFALNKAFQTSFGSRLKELVCKPPSPTCVYRSNGSPLAFHGVKPMKTGGEADIFDLRKITGEYKVLKIWKIPTHPDFNLIGVSPQAKEFAAQRIEKHQTKMPAFPQSLPPEVVVPQELVWSSPEFSWQQWLKTPWRLELLRQRSREIVGFVMEFVDGTEPLSALKSPDIRRKYGIDNNVVMEIFRRLHELVSKLHALGIIIGDFSDANVRFVPNKKDPRVYLLDADSLQFGVFNCMTYTPLFVDPRLCEERTDPLTGAPTIARTKPYTKEADWYAFKVLLFQSLCRTHPFGGVHDPDDIDDIVDDEIRPLRWVSVYHKEVTYPKNALPLAHLSASLSAIFSGTFSGQLSGEIKRSELDVRWQQCKVCHHDFASESCVVCKRTIHRLLASSESLGVLKFTRKSVVKGEVVYANCVEDSLHYITRSCVKGRVTLTSSSGKTVVLPQISEEFRKFGSIGGTIWAATESRVYVYFGKKQEPVDFAIDSVFARPLVGESVNFLYWMRKNELHRFVQKGKPAEAAAPPGSQTYFSMGPRFGVFVSAKEKKDSLIVSTFTQKAKEATEVKLKQSLHGTLLNAQSVFGEDLCWLFLTIATGNEKRSIVLLISAKGKLISFAEASGTNSWITPQTAKFTAELSDPASGRELNSLFILEPSGLRRIDEIEDSLRPGPLFQLEQSVLHSARKVLLTSRGLFVATPTEILLLESA